MQIQVAKVLGADVATTVRSDAKGEFAKTLGADFVINTRKEDFVERVNKFDIRSLFFAQKRLRGSMASDIEDFNWGLEQVRGGRIKPLLDHTLPLSEAAEAHRLISTGQVTGNLVLLPWSDNTFA